MLLLGSLLLLLGPAVGAAFCPHALQAPRLHATLHKPLHAAVEAAPRGQPICAVASSSADAPDEDRELDLGSLGRYLFAVLLQMTAITTAFGVIDVYSYEPLPGDVGLGGPLPWQAVVGIFVALSLRSRVFSPLDNSRPSLRSPITAADDEELQELLAGKKYTAVRLRDECEKRGLLVDRTMDKPVLEKRIRLYFEDMEGGAEPAPDAAERIEPSWKPPGVVFPLAWVGFVAPLRAFASSLVYEASSGRLNEGHLNDPVLLWLVLHLCIGDTWNTLNNVEGRTGAAVPGVVLVWLTTAFAAKQYYDVAPLAGGLLGLTLVWITVAAVLIADTWRLTNAAVPEPLYPYKRPGFKTATRLTFEP